MKVLTEYACFEETIKGSRFLSELFPCTSQNQARDLIKEQKNKYQDATHVVHAFIVGSGAEIMGMSDDGEPSGTAGRPCLDIIKGRNCTNLLLTVTRWFGGTLLGTGGLVKAYGNGAKQVMELAKFEELIQKKSLYFNTDYNLYKQIKNLLSNYHFSDLKETFETDIQIQLSLPVSESDDFKTALKNLSNGKINVSETNT